MDSSMVEVTERERVSVSAAKKEKISKKMRRKDRKSVV